MVSIRGLELRLNQSVSSVLTLIDHVHLICIRVQEHVEIVSQHLHLEDASSGMVGLMGKFLCLDNLNLVILYFVLFLYEGLGERDGGLFLIMSFFLYLRIWRSMISSTRSMDTYISVLDSSARMVLPLTGIVTSIFCRSFCALSATITSVSGVKKCSSLPISFQRQPSNLELPQYFVLLWYNA